MPLLTDLLATNTTDIASNTSAIADAGAYELVATKTQADKGDDGTNDYIEFTSLPAASEYRLIIRNLKCTADAKQVYIYYLDTSNNLLTGTYNNRFVRSEGNSVLGGSTSNGSLTPNKEIYTFPTGQTFSADIVFFNINDSSGVHPALDFTSNSIVGGAVGNQAFFTGNIIRPNTTQVGGIRFSGVNSCRFSTIEAKLLKMK